MSRNRSADLVAIIASAVVALGGVGMTLYVRLSALPSAYADMHRAQRWHVAEGIGVQVAFAWFLFCMGVCGVVAGVFGAVAFGRHPRPAQPIIPPAAPACGTGSGSDDQVPLGFDPFRFGRPSQAVSPPSHYR